MGLVTAKLQETAAHVIAMSVLVLNLRKIQLRPFASFDSIAGYLGAAKKTGVCSVDIIYAGEEILLHDSQESLRVPPECVRPLLEEYFCWLKTVRPEKGSKLDEAVRYSLNQKEQLTAFLEAPGGSD